MSRWNPYMSVVLALAMTIVLPDASLAQRRGAPGAVVPMTDVSITLGEKTVTGRVDAKCGIDERATPTNTRGYFVLMYPWFGQRVAPDKPQWRFDLHIRRGTTSEASQQFVFSFSDGARSGVIQTVPGAERMGSGTVKVTRQGKGAKFEIDGRTKEGQPLRATIDCSAFQKGEAAGG
jgi:hypothetical protein